MKKTFVKFLLGSALLLGSSHAFAQKAQSLFNGKNLDGWKIYGTEKWYVEKGELICESGPDKEYGYLGTDGQYKDFELTVQFKQEANGNSGVFFHSSWMVLKLPAGRQK